MIPGANLKSFRKPEDPIPFSMLGACGGHPAVRPRFLEWTPPIPDFSPCPRTTVRSSRAKGSGHPSSPGRRTEHQPSAPPRPLASFPPGPRTGPAAAPDLPWKKPLKRPPHPDTVCGAGELAETSGLRSPPRSRWWRMNLPWPVAVNRTQQDGGEEEKYQLFFILIYIETLLFGVCFTLITDGSNYETWLINML